jgi:cytochrome o ubiquinol oxidase subunit II
MKGSYIASGIAVLLIFLVATVLYLHGAYFPILEPAGPVAYGERWVILITLLLCAIVVIPVFFLLFLFAWRYRADSPRAHVHHRPDWDHVSPVAEFAWWLVPSVIIVILGVIMWQSSHALDPYKPLAGGPSMTVDVVALDWKWLFIYPEQGIASVNLLEIPENVPVHFYLTADAPMNSFWIPSLGGQIMVMPGMQTQLNLMASREGTFNGFSGNISGEGFSGMAFTAKSVSQSDFEQWAASIASSSAPLTPTAYQALEAPSEYNPVAYYSSADQNLFTSIMDTFMMPAGDIMQGMNDMDMEATTSATSSMNMSMPMQMP